MYISKLQDFSIFRPLDMFSTHDTSPIGYGIRLGETGFDFKKSSNPNIVNHSGILYPIGVKNIQYFAAEVTGSGITLNSIERYRKNDNNRIVSVYRWNGWENKASYESAIDYMAYFIRVKQESGYDPVGAIASAPAIAKLFPWLKGDDSKEFCSEDVYTFGRLFGIVYPMDWITRKPNPLMLDQWWGKHADFTLIYSDYRTKL